MNMSYVYKEIKNYINFIFTVFTCCITICLLLLFCVGIPAYLYRYTQEPISATVVGIFTLSTTFYIYVKYIGPYLNSILPDPVDMRTHTYGYSPKICSSPKFKPPPSLPQGYGRSPPVSDTSSPPAPKK